MDDPGQHDPERAEHVRHDLEERAPDVEAVLTAGPQQQEGDQVDEEADSGDGGDGQAGDLGRVAQSPGGLDQHVAPDAEQQQPVDDRCEDLQAVGAVGVLAGLRASAELDRGQGQTQPQGVGGHVGGVRQQRETAGDQPADHLDEHVRRGQPERDGQRAHVLGRGGSRPRAVGVTVTALGDGAHGRVCTGSSTTSRSPECAMWLRARSSSIRTWASSSR